MIGLVLAAALNWPMQYNAGVAAYRSNDLTSAATTFEQSTASPDRTLQQRAFYNLGNTAYRLGEADSTKAQALWERALKSYNSALALDPKDEDAKFNREFVKKKLEELQKQQQQQQQQKNQDKKQDQKKDKEQQKQDQQQQQQQQQRQEQDKDKEREQEQQQAKSQEQQKPGPKDEQQQAQAQPDKLDKQEAKALLDELRENEQNWNFFPEVQMKDLKDSGPPAKDW